MRVISNVVVGPADARPEDPSHVPGVRVGNRRGLLAREPGFRRIGRIALGTGRRSTGISPRKREPVDPRMPNLSPP